ncbi:hypothetical protein D3C78_1078140 [compost metagenome]
MLVCGLPSVSYGFRSLALTPLFRPIASTLERFDNNRNDSLELLVTFQPWLAYDNS